jgi:hypothetical protein
MKKAKTKTPITGATLRVADLWSWNRRSADWPTPFTLKWLPIISTGGFWLHRDDVSASEHIPAWTENVLFMTLDSHRSVQKANQFLYYAWIIWHFHNVATCVVWTDADRTIVKWLTHTGNVPRMGFQRLEPVSILIGNIFVFRSRENYTWKPSFYMNPLGTPFNKFLDQTLWYL